MLNKNHEKLNNLIREKEQLQEQLQLVCERITQMGKEPAPKFKFLRRDRKLAKDLEQQKQALENKIIDINNRIGEIHNKDNITDKRKQRLCIVGGSVAALIAVLVIAFSGGNSSEVSKDITTTIEPSEIVATTQGVIETTIESTTYETTTEEITEIITTTIATTRPQTTKSSTTKNSTTKAATTLPQTTKQQSTQTTSMSSSSSSDQSENVASVYFSEYRYVVNKRSGTIHYATSGCLNNPNIKLKNFFGTNEDIETLIQQGYHPCGNCNPN